MEAAVNSVKLSKNEIEEKLHTATVELQTFQTKLLEHSKEAEFMQKSANDSKEISNDLTQKIEQLSGTNEKLVKQCEDLNRHNEIIEKEKNELFKVIEDVSF